MAIEPEQMQVNSGGNDYVWVISNLQVPVGEDPKRFIYREEFRGKTLEVEPNRVKKLYMRRTAASRFLGQAVPVAEPGPTGRYLGVNGEVDPNKFGKPLEVVEMTQKELETVLGIKPSELLEQRAQQSEDDKFRCMICNWQGDNEHGLKVHVAKRHQEHKPLTGKPEAQKVSSKMPDVGLHG